MNNTSFLGKRIEGRVLLCMCLLFMFLVGCGEHSIQEGTNFILEKEGGVTVTIVTDFPADYYDIEEFNAMNESEVDAYNASHGVDTVQIVSSQTDGEKITLTMQYADLEDYCELNNKKMFVGTGAAAVSEGYDVAGAYVKANGDDMVELTEEELLDYHVVISNDPVIIHTYKKIVYCSEHVTVSDNKKMATISGDEPAIIVFK